MPATTTFSVHLPTGAELGGGPDGNLSQDAEWCEVEVDGTRHRIRFHDYAAIYSIPGLYETLFYDMLHCDSPRTVRELLREVLAGRHRDPVTLRVLDLGAGNGMVGEQLAALGVGAVVGVDILPEAGQAAERDRPGVYTDYRVSDFTAVSDEDDAYFRAAGLNALTTVAALGFGDIPPAAFARAYNYVETGSPVAYTIKEEFLADGDGSGFARLLARMQDEGLLAPPAAERRYRHRLSVAGEPLYYVARVADKRADVPADWSLT